jgi:hypothetical protein
MLPAGGGIDSGATCGGASGTSALTDSGEMVVLLHWDGVLATVEDADYIVWGDQAEAIDKSGEPGYQPETAIASQSVLPPGFPDGDLHNVNWTASRIDLEEGGEVLSGGNGITGHDETSETFESTWTFVGIATPGRRNLRRPPMDDAIGVGDIVVNEVLYDVPAGDDVNGDGTYDQYQDAFVEVVNVTAAPVDLGLWRIYNVRTVHGLSHEIPPGTGLAPGQALVVWGGGDPVTGGCGRLNQVASADSLWFNVGSSCDAADGIVLVNGSWFIDGHYDCDNAIGAAFVRDPDLTGPFVSHSSTPGGLLHSPGCRQDGVTGF